MSFKQIFTDISIKSITNVSFKQIFTKIWINKSIKSVNKQIKTKDYNYAENFKKEKHIESPSSGAISFSSTRTNIPNLDVDKKENNTRVYYRPMSIKGGGGKGINGLYTGSHKLPVDINDIKIQQKNSQKHQLDEAFSIELLVHGNTAVSYTHLRAHET